MKLFDQIKRKYLSSFAVMVVRDLEAFLSQRNKWAPRPDVIKILSKLLCNKNGILINASLYKELETIELDSIYYTLHDLEKYCYEFINQTQSFIELDTNRRPKIIIEDEDLSIKEVQINHFLQVSNEQELFKSLQQIHTLADTLDKHLKQANPARQAILYNLLSSSLLPVMVIIEQIYGILIDETH